MNKLIKNIYFIFILISSGLATEFYRSQTGIIFTFLVTVGIWIYYKIPFSKKYAVVVSVWVLYSIATFFLYQVFTPFFIFRHATYITVAYVLVMLYKEDLFFKYEKYVTTLALISLFFFLWQLISNESLFSLAKLVDVSGEMSRSSYEFRNFILHTVEKSAYDTSYERNYGFVFEPGSYSVFLAIAILFNLLRTHLNFNPKSNYQFYILTLALITTFSTTGYIAFGVIVIYSIFVEVKGISKYFYLIASLLLSVYIFFTVDFLYNKIQELYYSGQEINEVIERAEQTGSSYSGGRFGGFIIGWENFKRYPLLGRAGVSELTSGQTAGGKVFIVNGLANIMSQFGLFGIIVFFTTLYNSSKKISKFYLSKAKYSFFIIIVIGATSFSIHNQYFIFTLIFYTLFYEYSSIHNKNQQKRIESNIYYWGARSRR
ncbi:MAG: hypothetical protein RBR32_11780 [Bacteroidales bacterium]|nr:hypothetical protein [Bacteroidales bacterium]